jgi:hypothetical protein
MKRLATVAALALAVAVAPAAEAKFTLSMTVKPAQVWAKQPARVIVRTGITLPQSHGLRLHVVGPGNARYDTAVLYYRLRRIGPRAFAASIRFPRGGRWRLIVPNWSAQGSAYPPPVDHAVSVQPSP